MNKIVYILLAAIIALSSCSKENTTKGKTYLEFLTGTWDVTLWYGEKLSTGTSFSYEMGGPDNLNHYIITSDKVMTTYSISGEYITEFDSPMMFEELDNPVQYGSIIEGSFGTPESHFGGAFELINENEIIITTITSNYYSNYKCIRLE